MCQKFSINAEVAEASSLIVDDAVALARHRDEAGPLAQFRPLQGPEQVPRDSVNQAWALWRARPNEDSGFLFEHVEQIQGTDGKGAGLMSMYSASNPVFL